MWYFEFSLLGYNYPPLGYTYQPLGYNYQIKSYHWCITTNLVVIPQSDPLNLPCTVIQVLLKALPPVCMKYTARDESQVPNIAQGETECYICHKTLIKNCTLSYKQSGSVLSFLMYFILI